MCEWLFLTKKPFWFQKYEREFGYRHNLENFTQSRVKGCQKIRLILHSWFIRRNPIPDIEYKYLILEKATNFYFKVKKRADFVKFLWHPQKTSILPYQCEFIPLIFFSGVTDNQATLHEFVLLLERKTKGCQDEAEDVAASYPSLLAVTARHGLINPMDRLIFNGAFSRSVGLWNFMPKFEKIKTSHH